MMESGEIGQGKVTGCSRGGLEVEFGRLQGFVPGSLFENLGKRRVPSDQRLERFREYVGQELALKVIEVVQARRLLILSERLARRELRQQKLERLLEELLG